MNDGPTDHYRPGDPSRISIRKSMRKDDVKREHRCRRTKGGHLDSVRTPVGEQPPGILNIAVIGTGISGLAAAWLLGQRHRITVFEKEHRIGGHCHTVEVPTDDGSIPIDTGFMVYNERTYPNLAALFRLLGVPTRASTMSFSVSLDGGDLEYAGRG